MSTSSTPKFEPTWKSLEQYQVPDWFRDAKFGIWAHWGPQCQPEQGDWYARHMYVQGHAQYNAHLAKYGHPAVFGFKDVINQWKAENWNPDELVSLYKRVGAQYFFALANHHDNLDLWDSTHQPWNSVAVGPKKNIIAGWAKAARANGLKFGVSVHSAHAWSWYETAQGSDATGPKAGVPYDGKLTKADGKGTWWEGLDPQDLYAQSHKPSPDFQKSNAIHARWNWGNGVTVPDAAYCENFYQRTVDLLDKYKPDLLYFDDTALPLWPISDAGLRIAAHYYNTTPQPVLFGKILDEQQRKCMVWDIERGHSNQIEPLPWQTDTCLGHWHYERSVFEKHRYKSARTVIHTLIDVVSKNGNLLLSVPLRGDGTLDEDERKVLEDIAAWMDVHKESIFGTRPFTTFGEGPSLDNVAPLSAQGFNEGKSKPLTAQDIRYTTKGTTLYSFTLGWPTDPTITLKSLKNTNPKSVHLLGTTELLKFAESDQGLTVTLPSKSPGDFPAYVLKIEH